MNIMYMRSRSPRGLRRNFTKIAKMLAFAVAALAMTAVVAASLTVIAANIKRNGKSRLNQRLVVSAVPIIGANADAGIFDDIKGLAALITGFSIGNSRSCFDAVPIFYAVNNVDINILPVSGAISVEDGDSLSEGADEDNNSDFPTGVVLEGKNSASGLEIKNETPYIIDTEALLNAPVDISLDHKQPEILVVHTHASESYTQSEKYHYSQSDYARCQDIRFNVVRVGEELCGELQKRGFNVLHDKTINDYPSYNNSYNKTLGVIEEYLQKYPSIKCVFDVHRDAVVGENDEKIKFTADIDGEKVSQIMIVCGSDRLGLYNPDWQKNLSLALKIQNSMNTKYPGLMRPINLRKERFNLHLTHGSFIFEFGTHGNTLDEALGSVKYLADGIADVLN